MSDSSTKKGWTTTTTVLLAATAFFAATAGGLGYVAYSSKYTRESTPQGHGGSAQSRERVTSSDSFVSTSEDSQSESGNNRHSDPEVEPDESSLPASERYSFLPPTPERPSPDSGSKQSGEEEEEADSSSSDSTFGSDPAYLWEQQEDPQSNSEDPSEEEEGQQQQEQEQEQQPGSESGEEDDLVRSETGPVRRTEESYDSWSDDSWDEEVRRYEEERLGGYEAVNRRSLSSSSRNQELEERASQRLNAMTRREQEQRLNVRTF